MNISTLGGRRFLLTCGAGLATTLLQWHGKLDPAGMAYVATIGGTVGAFIAGNVIESKNNAKAGEDK